MVVLYRVSEKKSPLDISWNLNEMNMNSSSLRQSNLTKKIAQINEFLCIYTKFKATMPFNMHVYHFAIVRRKTLNSSIILFRTLCCGMF